MTRYETILKIREVLNGIDETETDSENGWWETSDGAYFGAEKLAEIELLIMRVYPDGSTESGTVN